jgi:trehalose/maltose hydrolase-like predicted phosphorylase
VTGKLLAAPELAGGRLDRRFEAVVLDWDGTAVPDRASDASDIRHRIEQACARGIHVAIVSGTHAANVDGQLRARPAGPGSLQLLLNRGSEVYRVTLEGPELVHRRTASPTEESALTLAAELTCRRLSERGLHTEIVSARLNRRKIDLIPEPAWAEPPKARIAELVEAVEGRLALHGFQGLPEVVQVAERSALEVGLSAPRVTSDAKHIEIGLTDKSDSAEWVFADLWRRGIGPGVVLVVGDEMGPLGGVPGSDSRLLCAPAAARATAVSVGVEPAGVPATVILLGGGPACFGVLLDDQIRRREERAVPEIDTDPGWTFSIDGVDPTLERAHEALLTLADGVVGTAGSPLGTHPSATPRVLAGGVYVGEGSESELISCPVWNALPFDLGEMDVRRRLELHAGLLQYEFVGNGRALAFSSLARPGVAVLRAAGAQHLVEAEDPLVAPGAGEWRAGWADRRRWMQARAARGGVAVAARESLTQAASPTLDRVAAFATSGLREPSPPEALIRLDDAWEAGYETLLGEHRRAWGQRWDTADVRIEGDEELQRAVRFALFHLMASVPVADEAAVGARGLSGPAYRGHVFWDACVFVLPFLAATHPDAARAMLEYRVRRLPTALAAARAAGRRGARFPWESAAGGEEVTPDSAFSRAGERLPVFTGDLAEHIVADVAWGVAHYVDWTGDAQFLGGPGGRLLVETARYWASRIQRDAGGWAHIRDVIGPDEYHPHVDDNAFTNVMARWNLRRAAALQGEGPPDVRDEERTEWLEIAGSLVDGHDPRSGVYEQFAGFLDLEPLLIAELAPRRPIAADLLLGRSRVESGQIVKQGDVLMLHHLLPGEVAPGSLEPNLSFYEPRTAHASSLSPGIHAALLARAARFEEACETLRLTAHIDIDDLSETTAGGLHLAAMGSLWQALAMGFAGVRPAGATLHIDPRLPPSWDSLEVRVCFRGVRARIELSPRGVRVTPERAIRVQIAGDEPTEVGAEGALLQATSAAANQGSQS